jgi:hypothetical protein
MPLSLRRRPRVVAHDLEQHAVLPQPVTAEVGNLPAEPPPAVEPVRETPARRTRKRQKDENDWFGRLFGEGFFCLLGLSAWLVNALFTILGITTVIGFTPGTALLGLGIHLGLSRAEIHLWYRWHDPWYVLTLVGCVLVDIGTTLVGLVALLAARAPELLGATPVNVLQWGTLIRTAIVGEPVPSWTLNAVIILLVATGLALGSERLLRRFWAGLVETWRERYPAS